MALNLEESITAELALITGLASRVFPLVAPQNTKYPYAEYELSSTSREHGLDGVLNLTSKSIEINVYHSKFSDMKALMGLVVSKVKTFTQRTLATTGVYCQQIDIENEMDIFESEINAYRGVLEIIIHFRED